MDTIGMNKIVASQPVIPSPARPGALVGIASAAPYYFGRHIG